MQSELESPNSAWLRGEWDDGDYSDSRLCHDHRGGHGHGGDALVAGPDLAGGEAGG